MTFCLTPGHVSGLFFKTLASDMNVLFLPNQLLTSFFSSLVCACVYERNQINQDGLDAVRQVLTRVLFATTNWSTSLSRPCLFSALLKLQFLNCWHHLGSFPSQKFDRFSHPFLYFSPFSASMFSFHPHVPLLPKHFFLRKLYLDQFWLPFLAHELSVSKVESFWLTRMLIIEHSAVKMGLLVLTKSGLDSFFNLAPVRQSLFSFPHFQTCPILSN